MRSELTQSNALVSYKHRTLTQ